MKHEAIRKALEALLGQQQAALALEAVGGRPVPATTKSLRSAKALWI